MAFRLDPSVAVAMSVRRAAEGRIDDALAHLGVVQEGGTPEEVETAVHEARKRAKQVRGLVRLVRPPLGEEYGEFNRRVRDAARELSSTRDAHALLVTFDALLDREGVSKDDDVFGRVRDALQERAQAATGGLAADDPRVVRSRRLFTSARRHLGRWELPEGFAALGPGLGLTYRRGRGGARRVGEEATDEGVHEWRKAVKYLRYQVRLLEGAAPGVLHPLEARLHDLSDLLGEDHDLAVLAGHLGADPDDFGGPGPADAATRLARHRQGELRPPAVRLGATLYAERSSAFVARVEAYWDAAVALGPEPDPVH